MFNKKSKLFSILTLLLLSFSAYGQDSKFVVPTQRILGADKPIKAGKLVRLHISPIEKNPEYYVSTTYQWKVYEIGYDNKLPILTEIEDLEAEGNRAFFGAGIESKQLTAFCIATHVYAVKDKEGKVGEVAAKTNFLSASITVQGINPTPPGPGPGPGPDPGPKPPDIPDARFKLGAKAYELAYKHVLPANRIKGSEAVANGCDAIAASIVAGVLKDPTEALKQLKSRNNTNLEAAGISASEWDAFGNALQTQLIQLYKDRKLNTIADYGDAFREIATGLRVVAAGKASNPEE